MPLKEQQRREDNQSHPGYAVFDAGGRQRQRRFRLRPAVYVILMTTLVVLGGLVYLSASFLEEAPDDAREQQVAGQAGTEDAATKDDEALGTPPDDSTLYLTVPKLGIHEHTVRNDDSEEALELGAVKLPGTEFPWQEGDTNTYIACHRVGFPGTESLNQCLNLPSMQEGDEVYLTDANGTVYTYRVSEALAVAPDDMWVTEPVAGSDVVSLQTCIETLDDLSTLGPDWEARYVVRAVRVA